MASLQDIDLVRGPQQQGHLIRLAHTIDELEVLGGGGCDGIELIYYCGSNRGIQNSGLLADGCDFDSGRFCRLKFPLAWPACLMLSACELALRLPNKLAGFTNWLNLPDLIP